MSIQAVAWALKQYIPRPGQKLVLIALANHADSATGRCWPKISTLAIAASMSPRSVHTHLAALETAGFIRIQGSQTVKTGRPNNYFLNCPLDESFANSAKRHPPKPNGNVEVSNICRSGSATACRPKNLNLNHQPKAKASTRCQGEGLSERGRGTGARGCSVGADQGSVQVELAKRIGPTVELGFEVVFALPASRLDELCAMQRRGTLDDHTLQKLVREYGSSLSP